MSSNNPKSPLEVSCEFCAKAPDALPPGRYKVVDPLHDRGTDRLLAAIAAAPDRPELAKAKTCNGCGRPTLGAFGPAPQLNYWSFVCQTCKDDADRTLERRVKDAAIVARATRAATTDLGDGLGLEVPERFCESTGPMGCGVECDHDRHNDDDRQRAAQERADAAELPEND